jgi:effector-binding domain-containing protein
MRALKITVIVLLSTIALVLIIAFFLPKEVTVSQSEFINAKPSVVFHQVNSMQNYANWSPFEEDSTMVSVYEGPEMGVGSIRIWDGEKVGKGSLEIIESVPYSKIVNLVKFDPSGIAEETWTFDPVDEGVNVNWSLRVYDLSFPMGRLFGYFIDDMMGPMQKKGLANLKTLCEGLPVPPDIEVVDVNATPSLIIYDSTTVSGIGNMLEKNYGLLMSYIMKNNIQMAGAPFAIYHNWDPEGIIRISAGIPVVGKTAGKGLIQYYEIPAGKAVFAEHVGGFNTEATHYAIDDYLKDFNLKTADYIWEAYITDPSTEPDSTKWVTYIYYPLAPEE